MIPVNVRRVLLAEHRVDFCRQMTNHLAEAYRIGADPYDGDCVVSIRKDRTQIRALVGDGYGLHLVRRRFEGGRLRALLKFAEEPSAKVVSTGELSLLLEGSSYTVHPGAEAWRRPAAVAGERPVNKERALCQVGAVDDPALFSFRQTPLGASELSFLQSLVDGGSQLSDVASAACHQFGWVRPSGKIPLAACSAMLRRLEQRGLLRLPAAPQRRGTDSFPRALELALRTQKAAR